MSDYLTPADIESILSDTRWSWDDGQCGANAKRPAQSATQPGSVCHVINFKGGPNWMREESARSEAWWRFWEWPVQIARTLEALLMRSASRPADRSF